MVAYSSGIDLIIYRLERIALHRFNALKHWHFKAIISKFEEFVNTIFHFTVSLNTKIWCFLISNKMK